MVEHKPDSAGTVSPSASAQIERADPRAQRWAIILIALGAAIGVLIFLEVESSLPELQKWIIADPTQTERRLHLIASGLAAAVAIPTLLFARHFWKLGSQVIRSGRFPPPGRRVVRDTVTSVR